MARNSILFFTAIAVSALFSSCGNKTLYTVEGTLAMPEFEGQTVYLSLLDNEETIDSAVIQDGLFTFSGETDHPRMAQLTVRESMNNTRCEGVLVLEPGKIAIDMVTDSLKGTQHNDLIYNTYIANPEMLTLKEKLLGCVTRYASTQNPSDRSTLLSKSEKLEQEIHALTVELSRQVYSQNSDNVVGAYALNMIVEHDGITYDSLSVLLDNAAPAVAGYAPLRAARTRLFHIENTSAGRKYTDIQGFDSKTVKKASLSDMLDNKNITLVTFWNSTSTASCDQISEYCIPVYTKYKDKGLKAVGVNVRDVKASYSAAHKRLGIDYPQLIDTSSSAMSTYGIIETPMTMLVSADGTILARDLHGSEIEQAVADALKQD